MRVAVFGNEYQLKKSSEAECVLRKLDEGGAETLLEEAFADFIARQLPPALRHFPKFRRDEDIRADVAISLGGDGTFLKTASFIRDSRIPILGINTGHLGFLADVASDTTAAAVEALLAGKYTVEERSVVQVETSGGTLREYPFALNEVAILKHDNSSLINVRTEIDGELLADYVADGLIVCTPTGSTGYSLSVNGPIISPSSKSFCISAVAPHSLNVRPVVVNDDVAVALSVRTRSDKYLIAIDGRSEALPKEVGITLRRAPYTIGVVKTTHRNFFETLRDKMLWGADQRST
ncbi:MAG: NAD kinase [Alloprevotella sp.]|nr:NAD kinase [Alloprevotella sp.]